MSGRETDPEREGGARPRRPCIVVTRPRSRAAAMRTDLEGRGIESVLLPSIEVVPPRDPGPLRRAVGSLERYDWVVLTSPAGVRALADALRESDREGAAGGRSKAGSGIRWPDGTSVAAVGPSTARSVTKLLDRPVELAPEEDFSGAGLLRAFREGPGSVTPGLRDRRILLPLAEAAAELLPEGLEELGAEVERVVAYRTVPPTDARVEPVRRAVTDGRVDLLTFTSPSTARNFLEAVGPAALGVPAAAIGPVTAEAAREMGYEVVVVPREHTVAALVDAVAAHLAETSGTTVRAGTDDPGGAP